MSRPTKTIIEAHGTSVALLAGQDDEFPGILESGFFNYGEFAIIKSQAGLNRDKVSVKDWVEKTNANGLKTRPGQQLQVLTNSNLNILPGATAK